MPVAILMPKLGLTMTEGKIVEWRKGEGDAVKAGDILFVLETEKVAYEVEAPEDGVLGKVLVPKDEVAPVGAVVAYLLKPGEKADALPAGAAPAAAQPAAAPATSAAPAAPPAAAGGAGGRAKASPLAKKMAREAGVDLERVSGTGPGGRVVAEDVRKAAAAGPAAPAPAAAPLAAAPAAGAPELEEKLVPLSGMRRAIANNMMASKTTTAQTYMNLTADATEIQKCRALLLPMIEEKHGVRITITDILMKIAGAAIARHPVINTRWTDKGIQYLPVVHMGMAMALGGGLIVPVIRDINHKTLSRIALDRDALVKKGRSGSFLPDDIKGSTFTLSTLGMYGIESFTANLNQPESAIIAVGAIIDKPVVVGGQIAIRPMMTVTLTYDHRIIDGAEAGKFMQTLKALIEEPIKILA